MAAPHRGQFNPLKEVVQSAFHAGFQTLVLSGEAASNCKHDNAIEMLNILKSFGRVELYTVSDPGLSTSFPGNHRTS